jgi:hypothetical protein
MARHIKPSHLICRSREGRLIVMRASARRHCRKCSRDHTVRGLCTTAAATAVAPDDDRLIANVVPLSSVDLCTALFASARDQAALFSVDRFNAAYLVASVNPFFGNKKIGFALQRTPAGSSDYLGYSVEAVIASPELSSLHERGRDFCSRSRQDRASGWNLDASRHAALL